MTDIVSTLNSWIDTAGVLLAKEPQIPLIDDWRIGMGKELWDVWRIGDGDLRPAIENALARDPDDLPSRFVALNAYYLLAVMSDEETNYSLDNEGRQVMHERSSLDPQELRKHLGFLVRLRDEEHCVDLQAFRWEIVNACAVNDYARALRLVGQLDALLPASTVHYHRGRLHFLIAVRGAWEGELDLAYWDLPLGRRPGGPRGIRQYINALGIRSLVAQLSPTRAKLAEKLTEEDKDHLRDAIKHLEKTIDTPEAVPSTRLMLALSYSCVGDGHNAARHYQWMVDNRQRFLGAFAEEEGPLWDREDAESLTNGVHHCLVNAHDDAGELDNAINATNAWITACPDHPGTYERMARLYQRRADFQAAAEWLFKEADRSPSLGEDPNISIILALGGVGTAAKVDEALTKAANAHPKELTIVETVVNSYWSPFARLAAESQQKWALGTWLLNLNQPGGAGCAAHCFAWVAERELRAVIFEPFKDGAKSRWEGFTKDDEGSKPFVQYLTGRSTFGIGQMLWTLNKAREPRTPLHSTLAQWLKGKNPMFLPELANVDTRTIANVRNREDHADLLSPTPTDAETMNRACRHLIALLHPSL